MTISDLKKKLETRTIDNSFKVFISQAKSSEIIINQYIHEIALILNLRVKMIESINEIPDESFIEDDNLYVIKTDKWDSNDSHDNCIVVCNSASDGIKFPKLEDWMIIDYVIPKVQGLDKSCLDELLTVYGDNYFRFLNDIDKIKIFNQSEQRDLLNQMIEDGLGVSQLTIWDLSNGIIKRDFNLVSSVLNVIDLIDVEPLGLLTTLYKNFKNIMTIQMKQNCTAEDLGISDKQFFVIKKYSCGHYSNKQLIDILQMLSGLEYKWKYEGLEYNQMVDYIICKTLGGAN